MPPTGPAADSASAENSFSTHASVGTFNPEIKSQMSVADIMIAFRLHFLKIGVLDGIPTSIVDPYPSLCAMYDAVVGDPKIAAFIAKHAK